MTFSLFAGMSLKRKRETMALDMTRTDKQRKRLIGLLEELFQLDQPDLDFGFYKIMHAKAQTVSNFVQKDLLEIIKSAFGEADEAKIEESRLKYEQALESKPNLLARQIQKRQNQYK